MIQIIPHISLELTCPECGSVSVAIQKLVYPGIRFLADCKCSSCGFEFLNDLPIGHALYYPMKLGKENLKVYGHNIKWFSQPLLSSYINQNTKDIRIDKKVFRESSDIVLINCLDYLYGHVLLKLFNAQFYLDKYPEKGIVVLIPKSFEWLIPDGVAEAWSVDIKLKDTRNWYVALDEFIQKELKRFSSVRLSPGYSHPPTHKLDISRFTGVAPFDLDSFEKKTPAFTFIYREDRLWHSNSFEYFLFKVFKKLKCEKYVKRVFLSIQNRKISQLFKRLLKEFPQGMFTIAGLGKTGSFPEFITDARSKSVTDVIEKEWCQIYSNSHLVLGIHGSNMLLPTAHAAGFIEILPSDRIGNITQDVFARYNDRQMLFLGRFVNEYSKPRELAAIATNLTKGFSIYQIYTEEKYLKYEDLLDVSLYQKKFDAYRNRNSKN